MPNKRAVRAQRLDFAAGGRLAEFKPRDVCSHADLVRSVPVARCRDHIEQALHAASVVMDAFEEIPARAIDQQNVRRGALREKLLIFTVRRETKFDQRVVQPDLVSHRNKRALLMQIHRCGLRI